MLSVRFRRTDSIFQCYYFSTEGKNEYQAFSHFYYHAFSIQQTVNKGAFIKYFNLYHPFIDTQLPSPPFPRFTLARLDPPPRAIQIILASPTQSSPILPSRPEREPSSRSGRTDKCAGRSIFRNWSSCRGRWWTCPTAHAGGRSWWGHWSCRTSMSQALPSPASQCWWRGHPSGRSSGCTSKSSLR